MKIENVDYHNCKIIIKVNGRKYTRKLTNLAVNLYQFTFNYNKYGLIKYAYEFSTEHILFKIVAKYCKKYSWASLKNELIELTNRYETYENEDTSIKTGPDSSKFKATIKGDIEVREDYRYVANSYSVGTFYGLLVTVGNNVKLPPQFYNVLFSIFKGAIVYSNLTIDDKFVKLGITSGTAWSGYGLR